jgi:hypothetical protein
LTVPTLAAEWGCSADQVLRLIHAGELAAVNIAVHTSGRPRYLVDREDLERFERRRAVGPAQKPRQRRRREEGVIKV